MLSDQASERASRHPYCERQAWEPGWGRVQTLPPLALWWQQRSEWPERAACVHVCRGPREAAVGLRVDTVLLAIGLLILDVSALS